MGSRLAGCLAVALTSIAALSGTASAASLVDPFNQWLPDSDAATWTYSWTDSEYSKEPTKEQYTVSGRSGASFRLAWSTDAVGNTPYAIPSSGSVDYTRTTTGTIVTNWSATPPPSQFPILCASPAQCGNSVAGTHFMLIWGTRSPMLQEPLVRGTAWSTTGGANNDVSSVNRYAGTETVKVPAFPNGVKAAKVESSLTQAGALGDPYGSGERTVWWVWGVGPVKIIFRHTGGPLQQAELQKTNLVPRPMPSSANYFPMRSGTSQTFRWRNSRHMRAWSTQRYSVSQVVNNTGRIDVQSLRGPIKVAGSYVLSSRLTGLTNLSTFTKAASKAKFPKLGPRRSKSPRHFFTPYDFMTFGFNPVLPAYPTTGDTWDYDKHGADWRAYGVVGRAKVIGFRTIRVPSGRYRALVVRSSLSQKGFKYGSGTRESYFASGKGLVKLVFHHRDGSVSTVERVH